MPQVHIVAYCMDLGYGVARGSEMLAIMLAAGVISRMASGFIADRIGGIGTLLSVRGCRPGAALLPPFDGLVSLYVLSPLFGLSRAGSCPLRRDHARILSCRGGGGRVGTVLMATVFGMALGGWMSGVIFDLTGSYEAAFLNGILWNLLNVTVMTLLLWKSRRALAPIS